jgi:Bax protein
MIQVESIKRFGPRKRLAAAGLLLSGAFALGGVLHLGDQDGASLARADRAALDRMLLERAPLSAPFIGISRQALPAQNPKQREAKVREMDVVAASSVADLNDAFERASFELSEVRGGTAAVPRLYVTGLPQDLHVVQQIDGRKRAFLRAVLPLVLLANEELRERRQLLKEILALRRQGDPLSVDDRAWLSAAAEHYKADPGDSEELLRRIDEVPVSLALAQAIVESGWGTSRFAREGNALFGQRAGAGSDNGMTARDASEVRVASFADLMDSVRSYMHNLNTHRAYRKLRSLRAEQRDRGIAPQGYHLAGALSRYADVDDYIGKLRGLIEGNQLAELENARLASNQRPGGTRLR